MYILYSLDSTYDNLISSQKFIGCSKDREVLQAKREELEKNQKDIKTVIDAFSEAYWNLSKDYPSRNRWDYNPIPKGKTWEEWMHSHRQPAYDEVIKKYGEMASSRFPTAESFFNREVFVRNIEYEINVIPYFE